MATPVSDKKKEWRKMGSATVFDTNSKGAKRTTKAGSVYHAGTGSLDGKQVFITVMPSRPGMMSVFIEEIPPEV